MNCHNCGKFIDLEMGTQELNDFQDLMDEKGVIGLCTDCYIPEVTAPVDENDIVYRLRKRAEIRRNIKTRKSVQMGERDRLADLLDEAADEIEDMRNLP